ncbi:MAG: alanine--tRNA ligase [Acidobacteriota bacterium]
MESSEIRDIFFTFFRKKDHYKVMSSPLVPAKDPTILFTNAGMNQFKDVFLGNENRNYSKAVSIQKCMRVSGKHNDFDEVGRTEYHHTFFEMLGNFSFGDYFKEKAIEFAWELMTDKFGFKPEDLSVSVFHEDDDAFRIWEDKIGIPSKRIARLGEKDNFWQMGNTGPCGPCSEIHYDRGKDYGPDELTGDNKRFVEIWNLVFMQYFKDKSGGMTPLPSPSIDTGMGMERLTALINRKSSNYETDLFRPIIDFTSEMVGVDPDDNKVKVGLNVIADHSRALSFLISDGVLPSNDGRGYILRRLLRRASRHGRSIGFKESFLYRITPVVTNIMEHAYPELELNREFISEVIRSEEERFERTLLTGLKRFEEVIQNSMEKGENTIPGREIFKLSDTYGFPVDFSVDLAAEKNIKIDLAGFRKELAGQQEKSRKSAADRKGSNLPAKMAGIETVFTGYGSLEEETVVTAIFINNNESESVTEGVEAVVFLENTPFYGESGGQAGDTGSGKSDESLFSISDTRKNSNGGHLHFIKVLKGKLEKGDAVRVTVDRPQRDNIAAHHTSTHLLHAALREVLGPHVKQSGSYVGPDKLRFDFTHYKPVDKEQLAGIEELINEKIRENLIVETIETSYEDALSSGAIAIFDEKYSDMVRMLTIGEFSRELCGGTHLLRTGNIGFLKIVSESSIASGIRRIEAVAGEAGAEYLNSTFSTLERIESRFKQKGERLLKYLIELEEKNKKAEKKKSKAEPTEKTDLSAIAERKIDIKGAGVVIHHSDGMDRKILSATADDIKRNFDCIAILSSNDESRSAIVISVPENLTKKVNASTLIKQIASIVKGNGGGRPDFAQAGGDRIDDPENFREEVVKLLKN